MNYKEIKKAHFIGIGGIGISAIARMMVGEGKVVSGSDRDSSRIISELEKLGVNIFLGHDKDNVPEDADVVVYTIALPRDNPEIKKARMLGIPLVSYPEMLGILSRTRFTVAVAGTHGKTTTTAMISKILKDAGRSPMVIVGSILKEGGSNFIEGKEDILIVEACEYKRSFLNLNPNILVITNIDNDHLDYYKDMEDIQSAFSECISNVVKDGFVITKTDDEKVSPVLRGVDINVVDYTSFANKNDNNLIKLKIPGQHNIENAAAALAVARIFNIPDNVSLRALQNFSGTWRRFEYKGLASRGGALIYDDYAHHPTEIKVTIEAAKEFFKDKKLTIIFQPHLFSRTKALFDDFSESFGGADKVIIIPVYAARENPGDNQKKKEIQGKRLADKIKENGVDATFYSAEEDIIEYLRNTSTPHNVVITMGAGDVYKIGESLLN